LVYRDASIDQGEEAEDDSDDERDPSFDYGDKDEDDDSEDGDSEEEIALKGKKRKHILEKQKSKKASKASKEADTKKASKADYGVSRGIDFQGVTFVVNFDTPKTSAAYTHRIGRTARGGASGTALTFVTSVNPKCSPKWEADAAARDAFVLQQVRSQQPRLGTVEGDNVLAAIGSVNSDSMSEEDKMQPAPLVFNVNELDNFRYRVEDTLRSVTPAAVKALRAAEIKREILNSAQLKSYFAENPDDLKVLRHDKAITNPITPKEHLKYIPDYLIPQSMKGVVSSNIGGNRPKRRKTAHSALSFDRKVQNSKMKDPLLNPPTSSGDAPVEITASFNDSQNYSTSGRLQWKARHKRGEFNPKNKTSRSPGTFTRGKKVK
jgi:ATP-dependent RNA helicase DDX56/DBP9